MAIELRREVECFTDRGEMVHEAERIVVRARDSDRLLSAMRFQFGGTVRRSHERRSPPKDVQRSPEEAVQK